MEKMIKREIKIKLTIKKWFAIIGILAAAGYFLYCAAYLIRFPNQIILTEYTTHKLAFAAPFTATIQNETVSVLKINDASVSGNITVNLQNDLTIETEDTGTAAMTLNLFGLPVKKVTLDVVPEMEVVPCGMTIGVRINTNGVMVLGTGSVKRADGTTANPCEGKLKSGDLILSVDGIEMKCKEDLIKAIENSGDKMHLKIQRDNETMDVTIQPVQSAQGKSNMIGVWVRDSTQGIGTITYYNLTTKVFGALGHGIMDVDTKKLMSVKSGMIMSSKVTAVKKGNKGAPGELVGAIETYRVLGQIKTNCAYGIYGIIDASKITALPGEPMKIATQSQIHEGPAIIRTNVASNTVKDYDIMIESVNRYTTDDTKGMVIRITDPELLKLTNGIVQGMSGSPIIQDGKVAGAVTHVFVQDPTKGYGIFIENMIKQEKNMDMTFG